MFTSPCYSSGGRFARRLGQRKRIKNERANHGFPGNIPVSGVVFGVPPKKRVGGTPTRTRETRVLPSKRASCGEDNVFAME